MLRTNSVSKDVPTVGETCKTPPVGAELTRISNIAFPGGPPPTVTVKPKIKFLPEVISSGLMTKFRPLGLDRRVLSSSAKLLLLSVQLYVLFPCLPLELTVTFALRRRGRPGLRTEGPSMDTVGIGRGFTWSEWVSE